MFLREYERGPDLFLAHRVGCSEERTVDKKAAGEAVNYWR